MLFLGFSAGLPFPLVFSTLSAWLARLGVEKTTIGFFSWIGITYSIKFIWAPVIDTLPVPVLTRLLGKRRSWMLLGQLLIAAGLTAMALTDPLNHLTLFAVYALIVAFGSATQDISIDAWRIEAADTLYQGAMSANYVIGYRLGAVLVGGYVALYLAGSSSWPVAYHCMGLCMAVGVITALLISEPVHRPSDETLMGEAVLAEKLGVRHQQTLLTSVHTWFVVAVISPFVDFFKRNRWMALAILALIGCYRISDITMGVMAYPLYIDLGFSEIQIGEVAKVFGWLMLIAGGLLGGLTVVRYGLMYPLLLGAIIIPVTNLLFIWLSVTSPSLVKLAMVIAFDNISGGFASTVFIAYLSSLTNTNYTATQYAIFSSIMTLPGKFIGGFSGVIVDAVGYAWFFLYAACIGLPAIVLVWYLLRRAACSKDTACFSDSR